MDVDTLAERILLDLKNIFKKDPLIDEFDVLPVHESVSNKCPVIHIEHKIALEDWCVKHVYIYAYSKFFEWKKTPYKIDPECLLMWTSVILLINPETETVWNARCHKLLFPHRKELVCQKLLLPENELKFSELVLSRKPKSSPVYAHRKWILSELRKGDCCPCTLQQIVEHELLLCTRVANLYPNNYYAWCHRSWILKELCHNCLKTVSTDLIETEHWASMHISDHCGFYHRQFLLSCYSEKTQSKHTANCPLHIGYFCNGENGSFNKLDVPRLANTPYIKVLLKELTFLCRLQTVYLGHETLWYHRRFILHEFCRVSSNPESSSVINEVDASVEEVVQCKRHKLECDSESGTDWNIYKEEVFLKGAVMLTRESDWERSLIKRHVKWLNNALSWPLLLLS